LQGDAMRLVRQAISDHQWTPQIAGQIREMRFKMQEDCSPRNLKRGIGGTVDVEFLVQTLQLKHAGENPEILVPGTLDAIAELTAANLFSRADGTYLLESYEFLRAVEARLRLMNTAARHDVPQDESQLQKLAFLLRFNCWETLLRRIEDLRHRNREIFDRIFSQLSEQSN
jgi:glutamate-ammonia-ligase adenylyltransferase